MNLPYAPLKNNPVQDSRDASTVRTQVTNFLPQTSHLRMSGLHKTATSPLERLSSQEKLMIQIFHMHIPSESDWIWIFFKKAFAGNALIMSEWQYSLGFFYDKKLQRNRISGKGLNSTHNKKHNKNANIKVYSVIN